MELHGGRVSVHSDGVGTGCTFTMEIPVYQCPLPSSTRSSWRGLSTVLDPQAQGFNYSRQTSTMHRNVQVQVDPTYELESFPLSVLVVDDAATNRKMLCQLIRPRFLHVAEASDGLKAVNHVRDSMRKPDIILMDFVMPNMDGPTATKEIRALGYRGIIIGVTGNALPADIEYFISNGANKVLTKPLRVEQLYAVISSTFLNPFKKIFICLPFDYRYYE